MAESKKNTAGLLDETEASGLKVTNTPAVDMNPATERLAPVAQDPVPVVNPMDASGRPLPEHQLTPEQLRIRQLENQLAITEAARFEKQPELFEENTAPAADANTLLIHVVKDGFTALDRVWYRGQEIEFTLPSQAYEDTKDRYGNTWLDFSASDQMNRWGDVHFAVGPWPGRGYDEDAAATAEAKRARRAPHISSRR